MSIYHYSQSLGNNANAGEFLSPRQTIAHLNANLVAGDIAVLRDGDSWDEQLAPVSGVIVVRSNTGASRPKIDRASVATTNCILLNGKSNVAVKGLELSRADRGIRLDGASDNNIFTDVLISTMGVDGYVHETGSGTSNRLEMAVISACTQAGVRARSTTKVTVVDSSITTCADGLATADGAIIDAQRTKLFANTDGTHFLNHSLVNTLDRCEIYDNAVDGVKHSPSAVTASPGTLVRSSWLRVAAAPTATSSAFRIEGQAIGVAWGNVFINADTHAANIGYCLYNQASLFVAQNNMFACTNDNARSRFLFTTVAPSVGFTPIDSNTYFIPGAVNGQRWNFNGTLQNFAAWKANGGAPDATSNETAVSPFAGDAFSGPAGAKLVATSAAVKGGANLGLINVPTDFGGRPWPTTGPWDRGIHRFASKGHNRLIIVNPEVVFEGILDEV